MKSFYFFFDVIKTTINYSHAISDAEDIFADTNSIDAVPSRPNVRRGARYLSAIQISDDEMDAVCIFRASRGFIFEKNKNIHFVPKFFYLTYLLFIGLLTVVKSSSSVK